MNRFPILAPTDRNEKTRREVLKYPTSVPWSIVSPYEERAWERYGMGLRRLAQKGGLAPDELLVFIGVPFSGTTDDEAFRVIQKLLQDARA